MKQPSAALMKRPSMTRPVGDASKLKIPVCLSDSASTTSAKFPAATTHGTKKRAVGDSLDKKHSDDERDLSGEEELAHDDDEEEDPEEPEEALDIP